MNLNTSYGAGAIDLKIVSSVAGAWSRLGQLPIPGHDSTCRGCCKRYNLQIQ